MSEGDWGILDLPGDPVQGDPVNVRALATFSQQEAGHWQEHVAALSNTAEYGDAMPMEGDFAPKFREDLNSLPNRADSLRNAHERAGTALAQYSEQLEQAKNQSQMALNQGIQAKQEYDQAMQAYNMAREEQNALPKTVYTPMEYEMVMAQWQALETQADRAWMAAQQAQEQLQMARQQAVQAGELATQVESACAERVQSAAPTSAPVGAAQA